MEPSPRNAALLRAARDLNGFDDLRIVERAVDERAGRLTFLDAGPVSTLDTEALGLDGNYLTFRVDAIAIDDLERTRAIDWLKMDVEGLELRALRGAVGTVASLKGLVIESNGHALHLHGASPHALLATLRRLGMHMYGATEGSLEDLGLRSFQPETTVDYVAVPGSPPLPSGWAIVKARRSWALGAALATERAHAILQHRAYADRVWPEAPFMARATASARRLAA